MTAVWIFIITTLIIQEPASSGAAILLVRQEGINVGLINFLWLISTAFDIVIGYGLGVLVQERFPGSRFVQWGKTHAGYLDDRIGRRGSHLAAFLLGFINVPYVNGFLFAWLRLSFLRSFALILIGNAVYWVFAWLLAIGVRSVIEDWRVALLVVVAVGLGFSVLLRAVFSRARTARLR